jgi:protease I
MEGSICRLEAIMKKSEIIESGRARGIEIADEAGATIWRGSATGKKKPSGPLAGRRVGLIVAPEFSDFQAYYLTEYLSEAGADVEFVAVPGAHWKYTRPTDPAKGVQGMWGMSLNPIPVLDTARCTYVELSQATASDYDVLVILGGHSADILTTSSHALEFLTAADGAGCTLSAIGEGTLPLMSQDLIRGRRCTGNRIVSYLLERVGAFEDEPVARDERLLTARDSVDTPALVRELCRVFDERYEDGRRGALEGRRVTIVAGEDFEDIELVVPVLELLYRGAELTLATFPAPKRSRPPLLGLPVVMGNFGVSVPLQDIPDDCYHVRDLEGITPDQTDLVMIPGAFCPWNMVEARTPITSLRMFAAAGTPIAAICHGAIPLSAADLVSGKHIAGVGACRDHVRIMGGSFVPEASAIVDGTIVTGRVPADVPEFLDAITYALSEE